ncbi:MAG: hypothetical protein INR70_06655 [Parafilimonas terrae]|nr:hypothetical protein [Parafilimonas terrae]
MILAKTTAAIAARSGDKLGVGPIRFVDLVDGVMVPSNRTGLAHQLGRDTIGPDELIEIKPCSFGWVVAALFD